MNRFEEKSSLEVGNVYQELLLQKYAPPCLLVNQQEEILLVNGEIEKYLSVSGIMLGNLLSNIVDKNIYHELLKGIKEIIHGDESVLIDGRTFHEKYIFYIYITPVITKSASEKLILIEFEDTDVQTVKASGNHPTAINFQQHFDELLRITEHDIRNLVSSFVMLLKFEDSHYSTNSKINDVNKIQEHFLSNFDKNLNKLTTSLLHYFN